MTPLPSDQDLLQELKEEEQNARIVGWDFGHIESRYEEEEPPWDYRQWIEEFRKPEMQLLDMETGGGEFLLSLGHPARNTTATEAYPPNVELCRQRLTPLGIRFQEADGEEAQPFADEQFDLIINRHGSYLPGEVQRVLKPGGVFITQQVGALNDRDLVEALYREAPALPYPEQTLEIAVSQVEAAGLSIERAEEHFGRIRFEDLGALVWFAKIIEWEFPGFTVEGHWEALKALAKATPIEGTTHRYILVARKVEG